MKITRPPSRRVYESPLLFIIILLIAKLSGVGSSLEVRRFVPDVDIPSTLEDPKDLKLKEISGERIWPFGVRKGLLLSMWLCRPLLDMKPM